MKNALLTKATFGRLRSRSFNHDHLELTIEGPSIDRTGIAELVAEVDDWLLRVHRRDALFNNREGIRSRTHFLEEEVARMEKDGPATDLDPKVVEWHGKTLAEKKEQLTRYRAELAEAEKVLAEWADGPIPAEE